MTSVFARGGCSILCRRLQKSATGTSWAQRQAFPRLHLSGHFSAPFLPLAERSSVTLLRLQVAKKNGTWCACQKRREKNIRRVKPGMSRIRTANLVCRRWARRNKRPRLMIRMLASQSCMAKESREKATNNSTSANSRARAGKQGGNNTGQVRRCILS